MHAENVKKSAKEYLQSSFSRDLIERYLNRLREQKEKKTENIYLHESKHCGVFVQIGMSHTQRRVLRQIEELGVKILPLREAIRDIPELRRYYWNLIDYRENFYTALTAAYGEDTGLFVHVPSNVRVTIPLISCFLIPESGSVQLIHNVVVLEPGAELCLVKGCLTVPKAQDVAHISVEEIYVGRGARYHVVMLHSWNSTSEVKSLTVAKLERDAIMNSVYFTHTPVESSEVSVRLALSDNAQTTINTLIVGRGSGRYVVRDSVKLLGEYSSAMIISRAAAFESCEVQTISRIEAYGASSRGHIECTAVPLSGKVKISTIPELAAFRDDVQLTHEAAIGKLSEEELAYLAMRGLNEDEAKSLLVLGMLRVEMPGLPESIKGLIDKTVREVFRRGLM